MKKHFILFAMMATLAITSCNQTNTENTPAPPAEKTTAPVDSTQPDGTTIKMNDRGVSIENKDGSKKNNVNLSKDSASIEIRKRK
jgi:hypothetical protein